VATQNPSENTRFEEVNGSSQLHLFCLSPQKFLLHPTFPFAESHQGYAHIFGSVNTTALFIQKILMPQLWVGVIVAMDDLSVHHAFAV
jgi:hypothetical protein